MNKFLLIAVIVYGCNQPVHSDYRCDGVDSLTYSQDAVLSEWYAHHLNCAELSIDSSKVVNAKYSNRLSFTQHYTSAAFETLHQVMSVSLVQRLYFQDSSEKDTCSISIHTQSEHMEKLQLKAICLDKEENVILADSIKIGGQTEWTENVIRVPLKSTRAIEVYLLFEDGVKDKNQVAWFDNLSVKVGTKYLDRNTGYLNNPAPSKHSSIEKGSVIPLSTNEDIQIDKIPYFSNKKIIALGECIHGSQEVKDACYQFARTLIQHHNAKIIQLEIGMDFGLKWDLFVQGVTSAEYEEEICNDVKMLLNDSNTFVNFLKWLRAYNQKMKPEDKVHLFGIDTFASESVVFFDYFLELLKDRPDDLEFYLEKIRLTNYKAIMSYARWDLTLQSRLGAQGYQYLLFALQEIDSTFTKENERYDEREFIMWRRSEKIMELFGNANSKTIVLAHTAHTNKLKHFSLSVNHESFGYYIHKKYKDEYLSIAFQIGEGYCSMDTNGPFSHIISAPVPQMPSYSLEYNCLKDGLQYCYMPTHNLSDGILGLMAFTRGRPDTNYFAYCSLRKRFDGIVFIKNSSPLSKVAEIPFMEYHTYFGEKNYKQVEYLLKMLEK